MRTILAFSLAAIVSATAMADSAFAQNPGELWDQFGEPSSVVQQENTRYLAQLPDHLQPVDRMPCIDDFGQKPYANATTQVNQYQTKVISNSYPSNVNTNSHRSNVVGHRGCRGSSHRGARCNGGCASQNVQPGCGADSGYTTGCATGGVVNQNGACVGSGNVGGGVAAGPNCYQNAMTQTWVDPAVNYNYGARSNRRSAWYGGVYGLIFDRDYEDEVWLSYPAADPLARSLTSRDADLGEIGGFETRIGKNFCNGFGWEGSYWGLFSRNASYDLTGWPFVRLPTLDRLTYDSGLALPPATPGGVDTFFNAAATHRVSRRNEIQNIELNLFKRTCVQRNYACGGCGGCGACCGASGPRIRPRSFRVDWLAGARFLKFDENFQFRTSYDGSFTPDARNIYYDIEANNNLVGFQMGNRFRWCMTNRLIFQGASKVGIYGNQMSQYQRIYGSNGDAVVNTGGYTGTPYSIRSNKTDVSFLGEIDLGFRYRISNCWSLITGYRVIAISGIALAPDQIPNDFSDIASASQINSNADLILHGGYAGLEYNF